MGPADPGKLLEDMSRKKENFLKPSICGQDLDAATWPAGQELKPKPLVSSNINIIIVERFAISFLARIPCSPGSAARHRASG